MDAKTRLLTYLDDPDLVERLLCVAEGPPQGLAVETPRMLYDQLSPLILGSAQERLAVLAMDRKMRVIGKRVISVGNDSFTIVCPKSIYRWALQQGKSGAAFIAMGHNHPSGDPTPSTEDIQVTRRVASAGEVLGIHLVDHLILGDSPRFTSLSDQGHVPTRTSQIPA